MSDIFNMIKANIERNSRKNTNINQEPEAETFAPRKSKKVNIDDFLIGEDEKKYHKKQAEKEIEILNKEIGIEKERKNYLSSIDEIDFTKLDKMKPKEQLKKLTTTYFELVDVVKEVDKELIKLEDSYNQKSIEAHQARRETVKMKDFIRAIVGMLPDGGSLKERLDVTSWTIADVQTEILTKMKHLIDRVKNAEEYVKLETERITKENKLLKKQLIKFEAELTKVEEKLMNRPYIEKPTTYEETPVRQEEKIEEKTEEKRATYFDKIEVEKPVREEKKEEIKEEVKEQPKYEEEVRRPSRFQLELEDELDDEEDEDDGVVVLEIDRYIENLSDAHKNVIKSIGDTGASRNSELRTVMEELPEGKIFMKTGTFNYKDMSATIKSLREGGFLDAEQVKLGARGGYNFTVYELTSLGKALYKALTGKKASIPEKKKIVDQHASVEHGFLIKDVGALFAEMGWTVYTERKDLRYDLPEGKRKDFDIVIEKDGKKIHIEVERGTHNDEDFFDAMDKIYQITNEFYFVAPNEEKLYGKTKVQFYKWINERLGGMDKAKGKISVNFATFEKIKKKGKTIWETIRL
jgi:hypothetical protein